MFPGQSTKESCANLGVGILATYEELLCATVPVDEDMIGEDIVDVILEKHSPVLVGHRVHRQAGLAVRRQREERHRRGTRVGTQQRPIVA